MNIHKTLFLFNLVFYGVCPVLAYETFVAISEDREEMLQDVPFHQLLHFLLDGKTDLKAP